MIITYKETIPMVRYIKLLLYLHCRSEKWTAYILDESVFALSFLENLAVFDENKDNDSTYHLYLLACIQYAYDMGVGIVSVYLFSGFARTF